MLPDLKDYYYLSEEEIKKYNENGFLLIKKILTKSEVELYRELIDSVVKDRTKNDSRSLEEISPYEREFLQCGHLWIQYPEIKKLTFSKRLGSIAKQLLNASHIRVWHDQALYKVPNGDATQPHQDLAYWPMMDYNCGTIWLALEEVTQEMGAMSFIPSSHKLDLNIEENTIENSISGNSELKINFEKKFKNKSISYNLEPGDATFHHGLTVHFTSKNNSDKIRKGMTVIYFEDGVRYSAKSKMANHICAQGSKHGEPISTERTPIIL